MKKLVLVGALCGGSVVIQAQPQEYMLQAPPPQPVSATTISAQVTGVRGNQRIFYWVVANYPIGNAFPAGPGLITDAPNLLGVGNFVTVRWTGVQGATTYDLLKTNTNQIPQGNCNCAVAVGIVGTQQVDNTQVTLAYTIGSASSVTSFVRLNNRDYAQARMEFGSDFHDITVRGLFNAGVSAGTTPNQLGVGAPVGACVNGRTFQRTDAAEIYLCVGGVWVLATGAGGCTTDVAANLPAAPDAGDCYNITDATDASDCNNVGGGAGFAQCTYDGATWQPTVYNLVADASGSTQYPGVANGFEGGALDTVVNFLATAQDVSGLDTFEIGMLFDEIAVPASPAANELRAFARDDGAGHTEYCVVDSAGVVTCLPTGTFCAPSLEKACLYEEFQSATGNSGEIGTLSWLNIDIVGGAAAVNRGSLPPDHPGYIQYASSGGAGDANALFIGTDATTGYWSLDDTSFDSYWYFRFGATANQRHRIGFFEDLSSISPDGVYLRYDVGAGFADANFILDVRVGGGSNTQDTGVVADTDWHEVRIRSTTLGEVLMTLDGGTEYSFCPAGCDVTVTIASDAMIPAFLAGTDNAFAQSIYADALFLNYAASR